MRFRFLACCIALGVFVGDIAVAIDVPDVTKPKKRIDSGPDYTIGVDLWRVDAEGHMQLESGTKVVVPRDVELGQNMDVFSLFVQVERIGPFVPNFRLHSHKYSSRARSNYTNNIRFGGVTYSPGTRFFLDIYALGLLAYYTVKPFASQEIAMEYGFELRRFSGVVGMAGEGANTRAPSELKYDITSETISYLPLVHLAAAYQLTNPKLRFSLEGEGFKLGEYGYYDGRAVMEYQFSRLIFGTGYRHVFFGGKIEVDESSIGMQSKGTFFRISYTM